MYAGNVTHPAFTSPSTGAKFKARLLLCLGSTRERAFSKLTARVLDSWLNLRHSKGESSFLLPRIQGISSRQASLQNGFQPVSCGRLVAPVRVVNVTAINHLGNATYPWIQPYSALPVSPLRALRSQSPCLQGRLWKAYRQSWQGRCRQVF